MLLVAFVVAVGVGVRGHHGQFLVLQGVGVEHLWTVEEMQNKVLIVVLEGVGVGDHYVLEGVGVGDHQAWQGVGVGDHQPTALPDSWQQQEMVEDHPPNEWHLLTSPSNPLPVSEEP